MYKIVTKNGEVVYETDYEHKVYLYADIINAKSYAYLEAIALDCDMSLSRVIEIGEEFQYVDKPVKIIEGD